MSTTVTGPTGYTVKVHHGVGGQISVDAITQYPMDDLPTLTTFVGNAYGFMVVMLLNGMQIRVEEPSRFGHFGDDPDAWVRRFYAAT